MSLILFWSALLLIAYAYAGFPLLVLLRGWLFPRPYRQAAITPRVSMIIAAYNEADVIAAKLDNTLALDYPRDKLEILVASDGSDDGTNDVVQRYISQGVRLLALPRQGKAPALNAAVAAASGDVLVFSDANSMYAKNAIRNLTRPFADPAVGGVAGDQRYMKESGDSLSGDGEKRYWQFDRLLKEYESRAGSVISATGAIYAIRRNLFMTVPGGVTDDFITSTRVIAQGYRLVFAGNAVAYEPVAQSSGDEFGRKVRVITRGLRAVWLVRALLNPARYGFYALQLFSHKVLRRLVVFPLLLLLLVTPFLWSRGFIYRFALVGQVAFYGSALLAKVLEHRGRTPSKLLAIPFFFCMVNLAALRAAINTIRGRRIERWDTQRTETTSVHIGETS